jgi:hypothetical protein
MKGVDHKYVVNWNFIDNHFKIEGGKHCELGQYIKSNSITYLND